MGDDAQTCPAFSQRRERLMQVMFKRPRLRGGSTRQSVASPQHIRGCRRTGQFYRRGESTRSDAGSVSQRIQIIRKDSPNELVRPARRPATWSRVGVGIAKLRLRQRCGPDQDHRHWTSCVLTVFDCPGDLAQAATRVQCFYRSADRSYHPKRSLRDNTALSVAA